VASATPFSATSLSAAIPDWLQRDLVSGTTWYLPAKYPDDAPRQLRAAAQRFRESMTQRSAHDERTALLGELRLRTATRNENADEARARFRLLRDDCSHLPTDVLREAVNAYGREKKFFPVGYSELAPYVAKAQHFRNSAAYHLAKLADEAEHALKERARLAADPLTPEAIEEIKAQVERELGRPCESLRAIADNLRSHIPAGPPRKPTRQDYIDLGVDPVVLDSQA